MMKNKIKKSVFVFFVLIPLFLLSIKVSAYTVNGYSIEISDEFEKVYECNEEYKAKYNKNYWTAWNKGIHTFSSIDKYYGVFQYYDDSNDVLYLLLVSRLCVNFLGEYGNKHAPYLKDGQYNIKKAMQEFKLKGINSEKFIMGKSTPETEHGSSIVSTGIGVGWSVNGAGEIQPEIQTTVSVSREIKDISLDIHKNNDNGKVWTYTANTQSNETKSEFISTVTQIYYLNNASNFYNKDFEVSSNGYVDWFLDLEGWENYPTSTSDSLNNIDLTMKHIYTVPNLIKK